MRTEDPLVAQRARILLGGVLLGGSLPAFVRFVQATTGVHVLDIRVAYWSVSILLLALARTTLRHELLNARVAARRGVVYAAAVSALTVFAVALVSVSPYLVALLLLPLLYVWPKFEALLNAWLYPQRAAPARDRAQDRRGHGRGHRRARACSTCSRRRPAGSPTCAAARRSCSRASRGRASW